MLTSFHLTATFSALSILFVTETALTLPLTPSSKYPVVLSSDTNKLVCYIQTADGRTLNLDSICKSQLNTQSQTVISDVSYDDGHMISRIVNRTDKTVYPARVNYEVLGKDGSVIERGAFSTEQ
jgi:hypothetical protein